MYICILVAGISSWNTVARAKNMLVPRRGLEPFLERLLLAAEET